MRNLNLVKFEFPNHEFQGTLDCHTIYGPQRCSSKYRYFSKIAVLSIPASQWQMRAYRCSFPRVLFSGSIGIGKSVVLIPLLKQPIITHLFRIDRASRCTSLQRHRHNRETLQAAARPGTDGISKCSSAVFEFAVPSWINYRADSYTTAKARAWRMRNIKGGLACVDRGEERIAVCVSVSLLHTRTCHPPPPRVSLCVRNVSSFLHECIAIVVVYTERFVFFFSPPFFFLLFPSFLFSYDNHPIQLCPFETMAQVRWSHA